MRVILKKQGALGLKRLDLESKIERIEKKDSSDKKGMKSVHILFKGSDGLGAILLSKEEIGKIAETFEVEMLIENAESELAKSKSKFKKKRSKPKKKRK